MIVQNYYDIDPRVRRKADALHETGCRVDVIALRPEHINTSIYRINGVTVHTIPLKKKRGSTFRYIYEYLFFFIMAFLKVTVLMPKRRYQVIDINTLPDFLVFAAFIPKLMGAKIVLDMHEIMPEFYMSKYGVSNHHWMIRLILLQEKISISFANHVLVINKPILKRLESRYAKLKKPTIVMNSANEKLFDPGKYHPINYNDIFVFMYHGTLMKIYGLDILLSAFAAVHSKMPVARLWIIGDGSERENLEKFVVKNRISEKVLFIGQVPQDDIPYWLNICDVGVLATRKDVFLDLSFSNKLAEYVAMGKPVIASRLKGTRAYFSEDALAYFTPQAVSELSVRMLELYTSTEKRRSLSARAKTEYQAINWTIMKRRYLDLMHRLAPSTDFKK